MIPNRNVGDNLCYQAERVYTGKIKTDSKSRRRKSIILAFLAILLWMVPWYVLCYYSYSSLEEYINHPTATVPPTVYFCQQCTLPLRVKLMPLLPDYVGIGVYPCEKCSLREKGL